MNETVNLIRRRPVEGLQSKKRLKVFRLISISIFATICFFSFILIFLNFKFSPSILEQEEVAVLKDLEAFNTRSAKFILIQNRMGGIADIIENRPEFDKVVDSIIAGIPPGIVVKSFSLDGKSVLMTVTSPSLLAIDRFLNNLVDMVDSKETISRLSIDNLTIDSKSNQYTFSVLGELP